MASLACLALAALMLAIRGTANWSRSFAEIWYGTFGAAVVLGLAAVVVAIATRRATRRDRTLTIGLALPALIAVPLLIWLIVTIAPYAD